MGISGYDNCPGDRTGKCEPSVNACTAALFDADYRNIRLEGLRLGHPSVLERRLDLGDETGRAVPATPSLHDLEAVKAASDSEVLAFERSRKAIR